jgi:hypothetical protein
LGFISLQVRINSFFVIAFIFTSCGQGKDHSQYEPIDRREMHLIYTRHAHCRMDCRHINETEIREILSKGAINYSKSEPNSRPDPKYALDGYTKEGQHLRVVFAPSPRGLVVITCIDLGVEWQCDCN